MFHIISSVCGDVKVEGVNFQKNPYVNPSYYTAVLVNINAKVQYWGGIFIIIYVPGVTNPEYFSWYWQMLPVFIMQ